MKNFMFMLTATIAVILSSCVKGDYINNEVTLASVEKSFIVQASDWQRGEDATGTYFYCAFDFPELTAEVYSKAVMQTYYCYTLNNETVERFVPLPYEDYFADLRIEYFTVEYVPKRVTFLFKTNTTSGPALPSMSAYKFVVRCMW